MRFGKTLFARNCERIVRSAPKDPIGLPSDESWKAIQVKGAIRMADIAGSETLLTLWDSLAVRCGSREFLVFQDKEGSVRRYTYAQFDECSNKAANAFLAMGVAKGEKVAIHMHTSPEFMMCLFGLAKIGAVSVPINEQYIEEECEYAIRTCEITCAIVEPEFADMYLSLNGAGLLPKGVVVARAQGRLIPGTQDFDALVQSEDVRLSLVRDICSDDPCEIIFTSGTTSRPKGVVLTHANMVFSGYYGCWEVSLREDDRLLTTMPACHSNFQLAAMTPVLVAGCTLIVVEKYSASRFWKQVRLHRATVTQGVAMMLRTLMMQPVDPFEREHCVREMLYFLPVSTEEKEAFEERFGVRMMNTYGSTESVTWVLTDPPTGERRWSSVGRAGLGYDVAIVDEHGARLPAFEVGEIVVRGVPGRTIMKEYYGDPEQTARALTSDGWLHTGDKGYVDDEGWFYFVDRKANMIKRSGENISASELENVLTSHPAIAEAAVIGVPDPVRDQAVKAFVLPASNTSVTEREVIEYCKANMAAFKVPSIVEIVDDFPRTCSMKIEKKLLR